MQTRIHTFSLALFLVIVLPVYGQQNQAPAPAQPDGSLKAGRSPGGDVGSGTGDIGKGAGKGAGDLAAGAGRGAADLVTLHPVSGAAALGKGGVSAGKNVGVGTAKGTGKIGKGAGKGIGKGIKKIF